MPGVSTRSWRTTLLNTQELLGMTPTRPRLPHWLLVALPAAGIIAVFAAPGVAQDQPDPSARAAVVAPSSNATSGKARTAPASGPEPAAAKEVPDTVVVVAYGLDGVVSQRLRKAAIPGRAVGSSPSDLMIAYEVRYVDIRSDSWWSRFKDRLEPIPPQSGASAWVLDDRGLSDLLTHAQGDASSNVLQAPKLVADEQAHATMDLGWKYLESLPQELRKEISTTRLDEKAAVVGTRVAVSGSYVLRHVLRQVQRWSWTFMTPFRAAIP
jgi:hypothetical protein